MTIKERGAAALFVTCATCAAAMAASAPPLSHYEFSEPHMGTTFTIVLYAADRTQAAHASRAAFARVAELDARLTDYRDDSEAMRVSREAVGRAIPVSNDLFRVLSMAQVLSARTGGAFDVTIGPLSHVWRRARRQSELPAEAEVQAARQASGYRLVRLDASARTVRLATPGMRLDFGGIAKGDAADRGLEAMRAEGVSRALLVAGGDVAVGDPPPGERGWRVAIAPFDNRTAAPVTSIVLANAGVSTSGDAEQWVEIGGIRYSHIFDPRTGRPLTGQRQATVVARDATTSDMLATTMCVLGPRAGLRLANDTPGVAAIVGVRSAGLRVQWAASRRWAMYGVSDLPVPR